MKFVLTLICISFASLAVSAQSTEQKAKMIEEMKRTGKYEESLKLQKHLEKEELKRQARVAAYLKKHNLPECSMEWGGEYGGCIIDVIDGIPVMEGPDTEAIEVEPEE